jgi:hypothetical protein
LTKPTPRPDEAQILRERAYLILDAFEQAEPSPTWARFREATQRATRVGDLRTIHRELRGAMAGLEPSALDQLRSHLIEQFGPDLDYDGSGALAERALGRGRISSEREYRAVQAYADSIAADVRRRDDFDALGALLDEYASRPAT